MALTILDPNTTLIIVELQESVLNSPVIDPIDDILERSRRLAAVFRERGLPVVFLHGFSTARGRTEQLRQGRNGSTAVLPELYQQPPEIAVLKRTSGAFQDTSLDSKLRARGVTEVVVVGMTTTTGVEATARPASDLGFNVTLAIDAMTDVRLELHDYAVNNVFPYLGETGT